MHWRWLTDLITILLTAAIAWAGWRQAVTAEKQDATAKSLLSLQKTIEDQRNKIWVFLRMQPSVEGGLNTVVVEIANLSQVGIWLEQLKVHLDDVSTPVPDKIHPQRLESVLGSLKTEKIDIRIAINAVTGIQPNQARIVTIWAEVEFWANGEWHTEKTTRFSVKTEQFRVTDLRPVDGPSKTS